MAVLIWRGPQADSDRHLPGDYLCGKAGTRKTATAGAFGSVLGHTPFPPLTPREALYHARVPGRLL